MSQSVLLDGNSPPNTDTDTSSHGDIILDDQGNSDYDTIIDLLLLEEELESFLVTDYEVPVDQTGEFTFLACEGVENIYLVDIDGVEYHLGYEPLEPGEFTYNPDTLEVIVNPYSSIPQTAVISYEGNKPGSVETTEACDRFAPELLARWNIKDTVTMSKSFQGHSSLNFSFVACKDQYAAIEQEFCNGRSFAGFNQTWRVHSHRYTLLKKSAQMVVTVSCQGWLASYGIPSQSPLDKKLLLKKRTGTQNYSSVRKLSEFAVESGVDYVGEDIEIRVPKNVKYNDSTTLRELLNSRAITVNGFVHYRSEGVQIRKWGQTAVHVIPYSKVKTDVDIDLKGFGTAVDGIKLHTEYRNKKINLDFDKNQANKKQGYTSRWVFENARDLSDVLSSSVDYGNYFKVPQKDEYRNPGINFDVGGRIKKATLIHEFNGTVIYEEHIEGGNAFSTAETYDVKITAQGGIILRLKSFVNPEVHWKEIRKTRTDYVYGDEGYLIAINKTGKEIARFQQESEKLEAISLMGKAFANTIEQGGISVPNPSYIAQAEAYMFKEELPIEDKTTFLLDRHEDHFDDTVKPEDSCNPDFVTPRFVKKKSRASSSRIIAKNPKDNEFWTFPLLINEKTLSQTETNTVTHSQYPYRFENRTTSQNAEGETAKNAILISKTSQNIGKPSVHSRIDRDLNYVQQLPNSAFEQYKNKLFYLNSPGVAPGIVTTEGSVSYPDIDLPEIAAAIARTELSIINTQNSLTATFDMLPVAGMEPGDRVVFMGKMWVIFNISETFKDGTGCDRFVSQSQQMTLGRLLKPQLTLSSSSECSGNGGTAILPVIPEIPDDDDDGNNPPPLF